MRRSRHGGVGRCVTVEAVGGMSGNVRLGLLQPYAKYSSSAAFMKMRAFLMMGLFPTCFIMRRRERHESGCGARPEAHTGMAEACRLWVCYSIITHCLCCTVCRSIYCFSWPHDYRDALRYTSNAAVVGPDASCHTAFEAQVSS